jgi:hypothetical protein
MRQSLVPSTAFARIGGGILRDLFSAGRDGFAIAIAIISIIAATSAAHNSNQADPARSAMRSNSDFAQSNADSAEAKFSLDPESPIKGQLAARAFQPSAGETTRHRAINSSSDPSSVVNTGWQYCLAASGAEHKVYISLPFLRNAELNIIQVEFAQRLLELQHEPVQCPISKYKGSLATMRDDAIGFNRAIGNTIVTLNWEPFSVSEDEDPIDATIYTGASSTSLDRSAAWQYCLAPSYAENKVYISAPFPKSASLHASETAFAKRLLESEIQHDAVQCPNGNDEPVISSMRQRAIRFNQDRGNTIVTLDWTLQSQSGG